MADGTYLMSTPRIVPRKNGLLSMMTAPEDRPHPRPAVRFLRSDPSVVIRGHLSASCGYQRLERNCHQDRWY